jgi:hypothetical protein
LQGRLGLKAPTSGARAALPSPNGHTSEDGRAPAGRELDLEGAAELCDPFVDAEDTEPSLCAFGC